MLIRKRHARQIREGISLSREYIHQLESYTANPMTTREQFERLSARYVKLASYSLSKLGIRAYLHTLDKDIEKKLALVVDKNLN